MFCGKVTGFDLYTIQLSTVRMDIQDFKGNFKYKLIIPAIYIISWVFLFVGPTFFQASYQKICIYIVLFSCLKLTLNAIYALISYVKASKTLDKAEILAQRSPCMKDDISNSIIHVFVVPNYKEDLDLLAETLEQLAKHSSARQRYTMFLAMESHEEYSDAKAQHLIEQFTNRFLHIGYTMHNIREFEQKGKASNVSWCVEHLQQDYLKPHGINPEKVMITILDADSLVPQIYIAEVEDHLKDNMQNKDKMMFTPSQIFARNNLEVPAFVRVCDQMHASIHNANMISIFGISFPLSNYTISYELVKKIGFWDTCSDAIAQDLHTTLKTLWKSDEEVYGIPIYAPFNQASISTGQGYFKDISAKFWQTQRHASAVTEVAYCLNMIPRTRIKLRSFISVFQTFELFLYPAVMPWAALALVYEPVIVGQFYKLSPQLISYYPYIVIIINLISFLIILSYLVYFLIKRRAQQVLYKAQKDSILRFIEFVILLPIISFLIDVPSVVIGTMSSLFGNREYVKADKVISKAVKI